MAWLHDIDPVALSLGPLQIHWYGLMYLGAMGAAWWLARRRVQRDAWRGFTTEQVDDLIFWGMMGVVLGGRAGYMLFYQPAALLADPLSLFKVWDGGMSFHGGLLGVVLALAWWSRKQGKHPFDVIDFAAPLVPIGLGLGRVGNFIGGELWGRTTDVSWAVIFPRTLPDWPDRAAIQAQYAAGELAAYARHPSQLYQAFLEGVVLFAAVWWASRGPQPRYFVSGIFAIVYALGRIAVEFVREPDADKGYIAFGWLTMGQLLSLPLLAVGVGLVWWSRRRDVRVG